jgi:xanthine/uracil permease
VIATVVDWDALLQVIWVSLVAGVGVTAAWGFALLGTTRALENGRDGRPAEAAIYGALAVAGVATVVAAIVFAIVILTGD